MTCRGCGAQLCLKFLQEVTEKQIVFTTEKCVEINQPSITVSDPVVAAQENSIVFVDDQTLDTNLTSLMKANNMMIVCYNLDGTKQKFAKLMGIYGYSATASISNHDDLISKLKKAYQMQGLRFIEIIAPCPEIWLSEPSNTIELARLAVESSIWPLFEIDNKRFAFTYKPNKLEPIDTFLNLQGRKLQISQETVDTNWRALLSGKLV
ncbi:MAG: hypothetical protein ABIA21_03170 [Candidatus Aenigmatarchaeota archaeon]